MCFSRSTRCLSRRRRKPPRPRCAEWEDQLKNAAAKKAALTPRIDLAKKRVEQFTALAATGAGKRADLEQAQSDLGNLESEFLAADATESQAKAQIAKAEADLLSAKYDLDGTTHLAPANGRVANLALRPGVRATQFATMPVMSFIEEDDPWVLAFFHQNELRYVEPGNEAEIFMEMYPGRIIKCKVDSILWATAQGQMPISGNLPNTAPGAAPEQRIAVRLLVDGKDKDVFLAAGARGHGAIYTEHVKFLHIIRKVFVRVSAKLDWFVVEASLSRARMKTRILLGTAACLMLAGCAIKMPPFGADIMPESARATNPGKLGRRRIAAAPWCRTGFALSATRS